MYGYNLDGPYEYTSTGLELQMAELIDYNILCSDLPIVYTTSFKLRVCHPCNNIHRVFNTIVSAINIVHTLNVHHVWQCGMVISALPTHAQSHAYVMFMHAAYIKT